MPRILFPDEEKIEECIKLGIIATLKVLGHATPMGHDGRCPVCGAINCSKLYQSTLKYDSLMDRERKDIVGCNKCLKPITPFNWLLSIAMDAFDMGRDDYERNHQPKPELPRETGKVIDSLALGYNPELSNF